MICRVAVKRSNVCTLVFWHYLINIYQLLSSKSIHRINHETLRFRQLIHHRQYAFKEGKITEYRRLRNQVQTLGKKLHIIICIRLISAHGGGKSKDF